MALARDVLDEAARLCSVPPVASWVSASRDDHVELRGYYYDCGEDIIDRFDFEQEPGLRLTYSDVEDGVEYTAATTRTKIEHTISVRHDDANFGPFRAFPTRGEIEWATIIPPDAWGGATGRGVVSSDGNVNKLEVTEGAPPEVGQLVFTGGGIYGIVTSYDEVPDTMATGRTALRLGRKAGGDPGILGGQPGPVYSLTEKVNLTPAAGPQDIEALKAFPASPRGGYYWITDSGGIQFHGADRRPNGRADISVLWMTNEWIKGPRTGDSGEKIPKTALSSEMDEDPFPRRAMVNGVVARFRRRHGLQYRALITEYDQILERWTQDRTGTSKVDMTGGERVFDPPDRSIINSVNINFSARG